MKTYRIFTPRSDRKLTCVVATDPADQAEVNTVLGCHPYGYTRELAGGTIGLFCPDSRPELEAALAARDFTVAA